MAFTFEKVCRACMESISVGSLPLVNKKKVKTKISEMFEAISNIKIKNDDQLPLLICLPCVSELNKCFAFREKCERTEQTLTSLLEYNEDLDDEGEESDNMTNNVSINDMKITFENSGKNEKVVIVDKPVEEEEEPEAYEEIEVTDELLESAVKANNDAESLSSLMKRHPNSKISKSDNENILFIITEEGMQNADVVFADKDDDDVASKDLQDRQIFKCDECNLEFIRKKNFENHFKRYHNGKSDKDSSPLRKKLRMTIKVEDDTEKARQDLEENPSAKRCKNCCALYLNERSLKLHESKNMCMKVEAFQCDTCQKVFTDQNSYIKHVETHSELRDEGNEPEKFIEPINESIDNDPDNPKKHTCDTCNKSFKMLSTLKDHKRTHTGEKPYVCSICDRGFSQNANLKQHLRRHSQMKPFKCTFVGCTDSFVSKGEVDSHLRKHTGDHPFVCESCGVKFTTSSSLVKHKRIHSGEKPYGCEFCPMRFTALGTLKNHTRTHTGEKPHMCSYCDRAFTQKSDKVAHERTHTGSRPFQCTICKSSFHQSGTLKTHMKIHEKAATKLK